MTSLERLIAVWDVWPTADVKKFAGAGSPWRLIFVQRLVMFVGHQYETCFMSPFWRLAF